MAVQRGKTFFVYLPAGTVKGCEEVGKALEIVVRGLTDTGSTARRKTATVNGAQRAITTTDSESTTPP